MVTMLRRKGGRKGGDMTVDDGRWILTTED
jgi:hypothetical protein